METNIREIRGIPKFLLKEYLIEMGGKEITDDLIAGDYFSVTFEKMEPFQLGALEIGQHRLIIEVQPDRENEFFKIFGMKTLRAGG